ncbi:MAG: hypothetical protein WC861_01125 [Candidatus Micrarchaeia archaeon]
MFVGTTIEGTLLEAIERRTRMGFTKSAIIKEALRQYLEPKEEASA